MIAGQDDIDQAWPSAGEIHAITFGDVDYMVGKDGVDRIEKTVKPGDHAFIPYVRVWHGANAVAEFNQHKLDGVFFRVPTA